ncbi:hypothetical protein TTHERM_00040370 (macronuclear) [Tetrahymena thermophila SB210]|uniref:Uncharacterized protein n=1 Tax=Tetrahymena thermophila (strain SB210) TaxID=312017 RepID=Q22LY1_TETTS|nr:hypothetical protein TTHERM_00040370 [Tetrahymena thermophila SB210]EAR86447.2 hypothetical protein TTHERM_00040370 [Tetrahymena thermophila SB210]|eukprot:XP_977239.2 hypothetical protein TTHERM_00040370 [Tetrahymena thermophila SB210]
MSSYKIIQNSTSRDSYPNMINLKNKKSSSISPEPIADSKNFKQFNEDKSFSDQKLNNNNHHMHNPKNQIKIKKEYSESIEQAEFPSKKSQNSINFPKKATTQTSDRNSCHNQEKFNGKLLSGSFQYNKNQIDGQINKFQMHLDTQSLSQYSFLQQQSILLPTFQSNKLSKKPVYQSHIMISSPQSYPSIILQNEISTLKEVNNPNQSENQDQLRINSYNQKSSSSIRSIFSNPTQQQQQLNTSTQQIEINKQKQMRLFQILSTQCKNKNFLLPSYSQNRLMSETNKNNFQENSFQKNLRTQNQPGNSGFLQTCSTQFSSNQIQQKSNDKLESVKMRLFTQLENEKQKTQRNSQNSQSSRPMKKENSGSTKFLKTSLQLPDIAKNDELLSSQTDNFNSFKHSRSCKSSIREDLKSASNSFHSSQFIEIKNADNKIQQQQNSLISQNHFFSIVNHYDEKKYNLDRFKISKIIQKPNQIKNIINKQQVECEIIRPLSLDKNRNYLSQSTKKIAENNELILSNNQTSLSPEIKQRSATLYPFMPIDYTKVENSSDNTQQNNDTLCLKGMSKVLTASNTFIKLKEKRIFEADTSINLKEFKNYRLSLLNSKIQEKIYDLFINKIGGIDYIQQSVIFKFCDYLNENVDLQQNISFDFNNINFLVFLIHALGVKLNIPKIQLQNNLKELGINFSKMSYFKQIMGNYIFEDHKLLSKTFETEFFRKISRCENYFMNYSLLEQIGGEDVLKKIVKMFHINMIKESPKYQQLNLKVQQVYKGFLFLIVREDFLSMTFDYLNNLQNQNAFTHQDFYQAKKLIQKCFECYGVIAKPLFHVLEIIDSVRHLITDGYGKFSKDQNDLDKDVQEISSDIYQQLTKLKEVEEESIEDKKDMTQENIQSIINFLLRPYSYPYYKYLQFPYNKSNKSLTNKKYKKTVQNLILSRVFPHIANFIQEYFHNSNPKNINSIHCASNTQKKLSSKIDPFLIIDIKLKLQLLVYNVKYNLQEDNYQVYQVLLEMSPKMFLYSIEEFFAINSKIKDDIQGNLQEQTFKFIYQSLFRFCLNQFIDDFPLRVSAYDIFEMIKEFKLTFKCVENMLKILWKILQFNSIPDFIIEILYKQYVAIKEFLKFCCNSQTQLKINQQ